MKFALNQGAVGVDGMLALQHAVERNVKVMAGNFSEDFGGLEKYNFARALDGAAEDSLNDQVVALDHHALHGAFFLNVYIAACLDATMPIFIDLVVAQADVGSTGETVRGLGADGGLVLAVTFCANDAAFFGR